MNDKKVIVYHLNNEREDYKSFKELLQKNDKIIFLITSLFIIIGIFYIFISTKWWQAEVTLELGQYINDKNDKIIYIENSKYIKERLQAIYVKPYKYDKNKNFKINKIITYNDAPKLLTIVAIGKSKEIALNKLKNITDKLIKRHKLILNEKHKIFIIKKNKIDKDIYKIRNEYIKNNYDEIKSIKNIYIPTVENKIFDIYNNIKQNIKIKNDLINKIRNCNNTSLCALLILQLKNIESEIISNKLLVHGLKQNKANLNNKITKLERTINTLQNVNIKKLEEDKNILSFFTNENNFFNTKILGDFVIKNEFVKPKILLILFFSFILGLLISIIFILSNNKNNKIAI